MIGAILALASIFPIVVIGLSRFFGCSTAHADYEPGSPMKRVETTASTHPMMHVSVSSLLDNAPKCTYLVGCVIQKRYF